jgi:predicted GTPase
MLIAYHCVTLLDYFSKLFEKVRRDADQLEAAKLIACKPVVLLSGKGGCGKTEVVGCVFKYATGLLDIER